MKERRSFKRYSKKSSLTLSVNGKSYEAKIIDYSLDGMGLATELNASIQNGDKVIMVSETPRMNATALVVWKYDMDSEKRIGLKITSQLKGRLEDFKLSDTLIGIQLTETSGILRVEQGKTVRKIHIKEGDIVFASSNQKSEHLGEMLVREGKITPEQLLIMKEEIEGTNERLGRVLVRRSVLDPENVRNYVKKQTEEIILSLLAFEEGTFFFDEMPSLPEDELITLKLSAASLIYAGTKRIDDINRIMKEVHSLESVVSFSSDPLDLFQSLQLDMSSQKVLSCLSDHASIKDIIKLTGMDQDEVLKTVYALLNTRIIEVGNIDHPKDDLPEEEVKEIFEEQKIDPKFIETVEDLYGKYQDMNYFNILGVTCNSSLSEIKKAYYKIAKQYHPDNHFLYNDDNLKHKLCEIFSYIHDGYTTLSDPITKAEYESSLERGSSQSPFSKKGKGKRDADENEARKRFNIGRALYRDQRYEEAEHAFRQVLYMNDSIAKYHYYHGVTLMKLRKFSEAKIAIEKSIAIDPVNSTYYKAIANIYSRKGCPTRAEYFLKKASDLEQDYSSSYDNSSKTFHI
jgi:tetratricopeptide (TPR) repeat protein